MNEIWLQVALVAVLIVLNALFAGSETALVSLREAQIRKLEQGGRRQQALARLARDPNQFLSSIQIGITLAGFLASATAAVTLARPLIDPLEGVFGDAARAMAILAVTLVISYLTLVFGELAPKRIALQRAVGWGTFAARPLTILGKVTTPVVWLLSKSTDATVRLFGANPSEQREEIGEEELRDMVTSRTAWPSLQRDILAGAFEIKDRRLREITVPRTEMFSLRGDGSVTDAIGRLLESGHSRAPVTGDDIDDVIGIVHMRDLIGVEGTVGEHARELFSLPETVPVMNALREMQRTRQQMAVVIDEHGGVDGIVTIEDLLEELVGEIYDEFDHDVTDVERAEDGSILVAGGFPVHDLEDIGIDLPRAGLGRTAEQTPGGYTTVAGVMLEALDHIPQNGESVSVGGYTLVAEEVDRNTIVKMRIKPDPDQP